MNPSIQPRSGRRPGPARARPAPWALALALLASVPGCRSPEDFKREADEDVYPMVERERERLGVDGAFTIEPREDSLRADLLGGDVVLTEPLELLDLLEIAAANSRDYQTRKETVYRAALNVTRERWLLHGQGSVRVDAGVSGSGSSSEFATVTPSASLTRILGTGASVVLGAAWSFSKSLPDGSVSSSLSGLFDVRQPLLRGFGRRIVGEPLTQAERELVYEVRSFERFRRVFAFDVAQRAYRVLQQMNRVQNELRNQENLVLLRERNEALSEAGRLSEIQVDQARQNELAADNRVINAQVGLGSQIDDLKLFLGLPVEARLELDPAELDRLSGDLLDEEPPAEVDALDFALGQRLDLMTALDRVVDSERKIGVAADALRMGLDLSAGLDSVSSDPGQPFDFDLKDLNWSVGASLDLPVNRLLERNAFRTAIITRNVSRRGAEQLGDTIVADVRDDLRRLRASRENYGIQTNAVVLARRRIESVQLNLQAGRATTRDLLESQEALVNAENAATEALIEYTLARLGLFVDMERLRIDEEGIRVVGMDEPIQEGGPEEGPDTRP